MTEGDPEGACNALLINNTDNGYLPRQTVTARNSGTTLQGATYGYDTAGRLLTVTHRLYTVIYAYQPDSSLLKTVAFAKAETDLGVHGGRNESHRSEPRGVTKARSYQRDWQFNASAAIPALADPALPRNSTLPN